jgi:MFS transporter, YNFM family, putative membrane transport protein
MQTDAAPSMSLGALSSQSYRSFVIGLTAFLTVVDLFAVQAILPQLTRAYGVSPAAMGTAVNASTMGMAFGGLAVALFSRHIDRRNGVLWSLVLLAIPTALLPIAPDLTVFAALRIVQGVCMAAAFTLTLAYLGEHTTGRDTAGAFAAYITGNVASNLFGRLIAAWLADTLGLDVNFYAFALLNLAGAALVYFTIDHAPRMQAGRSKGMSALATWLEHFRNPPLRIAFCIGFCILFAFIGTFTYVNFVLAAPPFQLSPIARGFVYFVFLPAVFTTPLAGRLVDRLGTRKAFWVSMLIAGLGLPMLVTASLPAVLLGMVLVAIGTFLAQAIATGFVSRAATADRGSASGLYLASYFLGGLVGSAILGRAYMAYGWEGCVVGIGASLLLAVSLAAGLRKQRPVAG